MAIAFDVIVQKFGGVSVACPETIQKTACHVANAVEQGQSVLVVVSAMQGVTDQLESYVSKLSLLPHQEERDAVLSAGEQITCGLMALALQNLGLKASSWLSWQIPIHADSSGTDVEGRIRSIETDKLKAYLAEGGIPVIAGFQGINASERLTTLGRGGSDITAVALAACLGAESCDFYKDVPGIMSADPTLVPSAQVIDSISIAEMLELSALGAKVLQTRAVELAAIENVSIRVLPTFHQGAGTHLYHDYQETRVEKPLVRSLVCQPHQSQVTLSFETGDDHQKYSSLIDLLKTSRIPFDMLSALEQSQAGKIVLSFALDEKDAERAETLVKNRLGIPSQNIDKKTGLSKLSLVGVGLQGHPEILQTLFKTLAHQNISVLGLSTSQCRLSFMVDETFAEMALRLLHKAFIPLIPLDKTKKKEDRPLSFQQRNSIS